MILLRNNDIFYTNQYTESADYLDFENPDAGQGKPRNNEYNNYFFSLISRIMIAFNSLNDI